MSLAWTGRSRTLIHIAGRKRHAACGSGTGWLIVNENRIS
jgi:hypothetical protein